MNPEMSYGAKPAGAEAAPRNFFSRLIGVYFSPGETFAEMAQAPRALAPIIALTLLFIASGVFVASRMPMDKISEERIQQQIASGQITEERAEQQREQMRKIAPFMKSIIPISTAIWAVVMVFAFAGLAKLVSMMMGIENKYMPLVSVTTYTMLAVYIVSTVIFAILLFIKPIDEFDWSNPVGSNLAALLAALGVGGLSKFVKGLLSYVDVFYIWKVALIAIGCAAVSHKLKPSSAMVYAGVVACVVALIGGAWAAMFGV
ncbi:MAG TPA: YIP1 family protein [Blastocatellia bacterium]|nr:YIP1 family protein [Blastocatellia bacterium]